MFELRSPEHRIPRKQHKRTGKSVRYGAKYMKYDTEEIVKMVQKNMEYSVEKISNVLQKNKIWCNKY